MGQRNSNIIRKESISNHKEFFRKKTFFHAKIVRTNVRFCFDSEVVIAAYLLVIVIMELVAAYLSLLIFDNTLCCYIGGTASSYFHCERNVRFFKSDTSVSVAQSCKTFTLTFVRWRQNKYMRMSCSE